MIIKNSPAIYLFASYSNSKAKKEEGLDFKSVVWGVEVTAGIENTIALGTPSFLQESTLHTEFQTSGDF